MPCLPRPFLRSVHQLLSCQNNNNSNTSLVSLTVGKCWPCWADPPQDTLSVPFQHNPPRVLFGHFSPCSDAPSVLTSTYGPFSFGECLSHLPILGLPFLAQGILFKNPIFFPRYKNHLILFKLQMVQPGNVSGCISNVSQKFTSITTKPCSFQRLPLFSSLPKIHFLPLYIHPTLFHSLSLPSNTSFSGCLSWPLY